MKKIAYSIAVLLAACACTKEIEMAETGTSGEECMMTFSASSENDGDETKVSLAEGNKLFWDKDDSIAVFSLITTSSGNAPMYGLSLTDGAGTTNATFKGNVEKSTDGYFAIYPYSKSMNFICPTTSLSSSRTLSVQVPDLSVQYAREGSIPEGMPMIAYANAPADASSPIGFQFKNIFAYIKFTINYKCKSVKVTPGGYPETLTPSFYAAAVRSEGLTYHYVKAKENSVTLVDKDGGALMPGTYYIAVTPQAIIEGEGLIFEFTSALDETKTVTKTTKNSVQFKRGVVTNFGTFDLSSLIEFKGTGTESDPYLISDFCDLTAMEMRIHNSEDGYSSACYRQTQDIDFGGRTLTPIGSKNYFSGTYDGDGYTISNVKYDKCSLESRYRSAMFACIRNATIKNLTIKNPSFAEFDEEVASTVSPLVSVALSDNGTNSISNCHVTSDEPLEMKDCRDLVWGGIVAFNESYIGIQNCTSDIDLYLTSHDFKSGAFSDGYMVSIGGIVGYTSGSCNKVPSASGGTSNAFTAINYCRNYGSLHYDGATTTTGIVKYLNIGGILGYAFDSSGDVCCRIGPCVSYGEISIMNAIPSRYNYIGGIVGQMDSDGYFSNDPVVSLCLNKGSIMSDRSITTYAGGIMGWCYDDDTFVSSCVNTGSSNVSDGYSMYYCKGSMSCTSNFTTVSWGHNNGCEVDASLTSDKMNKASMGLGKWTGNAADGSLDIEF